MSIESIKQAVAQAPRYELTENADSDPAPDVGVVLQRGSEIVLKAVAWLWLHWLARGKLHLLAGPPGLGKTTIALSWAATVTVGGKWPDGSPCERGSVLIWSGEDDPADTMLPRLVAMGADPERIHFVSGIRCGEEVLPFDPARDMAALAAAAQQISDVRLIIVDPIVSAVAGDSHKNTEVRRALQPLVDLAAKLEVAVLGITHLSKGTAGRDPTERVTGSIAFTAVVRVVLLVGKVKGEEGEDQHVLVRSKSNIGPDDGGFLYEIEQTTVSDDNIPASKVAWGEAVEGTARELLRESGQQTDPVEVSALDDAKHFLTSELREQPKPAKELLREAKEAGHSERTLMRAKSELHIESLRDGKTWKWALPVKDAKMAKGANVVPLRNLGTLGILDSVEHDEGGDY